MPEDTRQDYHSSDTSVGKNDPEKFDWTELGQHCAFDWTPEPMYTCDDVYVPEEFEDEARDVSPLSEAARAALMNLDSIFSKSDVAPRRIEIEQAWKADHYDRGYQFLLKNRNGGWTMPGTGSGYGAADQKNISQFYQTNVYGEKGEIVVAALSREVPRVEFFPANPDHAPDQEMADVADDLKEIWAKNNNLMGLLQDTSKIFWNEDRALFWTRYELNGEEFGYEEEDEPVVPENELTPPDEPTGDDAGLDYEIGNQSPVEPASVRRPRGRVRTTALGKLDHKVPIYVDGQFQMGMIQICEDKDTAVAKAQFPWMQDKIKGGGDGTGETELDRIARENVRQAVPGQYVTGDAINRHCVIKHSYIRRAMFFDAEVKEEVRKELLEKFPDGCLLVKASTEFCYARNESMDDHVAVGHPFPGKGQNRRALGESLLPIQDYINELVALALAFAKRTIAKKWMDAETFNVEALKNQTNVPGSIGPFQRQPGVPVDQLIFIEPTPTPQPWLIEWIKWIITSLSEQISGALPSLFGAQITGQVGSEGVGIQRDQAMQRVGCPWNSIQAMFAQAARQAAMLTAKCANKDIVDVIPGKGKISIKLNRLKGSVLCFPESNPEFPESWAQKETRIMSVVDKAMATPGSEFSNMVLDPKNLKAIKSAIRLPGFVIKGAASVEKQEAEFEILLRSGTVPNPKKVKLQQLIEQTQQQVAAIAGNAQQTGQDPAAEDQQMVQHAAALLPQLQQVLQTLPDEISTVVVRGDGSEDDQVEASVCFDWLNSPSGRKFNYGTPEQQSAFKNVLLHWKEHTDSYKKLNPPPQPPPPKVSFSVATDKMPAPEQAEILTAGGIVANPDDFVAHQTKELNRDVAKKVIPDTIYTQGLHDKTATPPGAAK